MALEDVPNALASSASLLRSATGAALACNTVSVNSLARGSGTAAATTSWAGSLVPVEDDSASAVVVAPQLSGSPASPTACRTAAPATPGTPPGGGRLAPTPVAAPARRARSIHLRRADRYNQRTAASGTGSHATYAASSRDNNAAPVRSPYDGGPHHNRRNTSCTTSSAQCAWSIV